MIYFLNSIQFVETALLFSAMLFSLIMFVRTRDKLTGRTFFLLFPVATVFFISYMYSNAKLTGDMGDIKSWVTSITAAILIILIVLSILAACFYVIKLFPQNKRINPIVFSLLGIAGSATLTIATAVVLYISQTNLYSAVTNALWAFYPICSLTLFILALNIIFRKKKIIDKHNLKLAQYFIAAFIPQIVFTIIDFLFMRDIAFQFTHLSYSVFSILVFLDLSKYFYSKYDAKIDISKNRQILKEEYEISERELEVIELLIDGQTNHQISEKLYISVNTVKTHVKNIYKKLNVSNRLQLVNRVNEVE